MEGAQQWPAWVDGWARARAARLPVGVAGGGREEEEEERRERRRGEYATLALVFAFSAHSSQERDHLIILQGVKLPVALFARRHFFVLCGQEPAAATSQ